jgi:hypothetical protein
MFKLDRELGCPFHTDAEWVRLRDGSPAEWADAVAFDAQIRDGSARATAEGHPLRGQFFLHRQRVPLDQVVLRPRETGEDTPGCSPWACPHPSEQPDEPGDVVGAGKREGRE